MKTKQNPLSDLPLRYRPKNKKYYIDTVTGDRIHVSNIHKHIPDTKETQELKHELIMAKRYDLKD